MSRRESVERTRRDKIRLERERLVQDRHHEQMHREWEAARHARLSEHDREKPSTPLTKRRVRIGAMVFVVLLPIALTASTLFNTATPVGLWMLALLAALILEMITEIIE